MPISQRVSAAMLVIMLMQGSALDDGLALTPPRGWRSWNFMLLEVNQDKILAQAAAMARSYPDLGPSLLELNYTNVGIDDGWQACGDGVNGTFHNASGWPMWNFTRFPDPKAMVAEAKTKHGVGLGWYANNCYCHETQGHKFPYDNGGNILQDAQSAALVGFTGIKVDSCGPALNMTQWAVDLKKAGNSEMIIEDCLDKGFWQKGLEPPTPTLELLRECPSHFYRVTRDVGPDFYSTTFNINFANNKLAPYLDDPTAAPRPGCWAYPDMLEVGVPPMTFVESRTHFAAWCILSAPLVLGFDLTDESVYREVYPIIANAGALEVSAMWAGNSGRLVKNSTESLVHLTPCCAGNDIPYGAPNQTFASWQIWAKPMRDDHTRWAVLLVNVGVEEQDIPLTYADVSPALGDDVAATDVWTGRRVEVAKRATTFKAVAAHDSVFLFVQKGSVVQVA